VRIRQIRPEFFTDATMAALSPQVKLTYIGLWIVADDAGFLKLDLTTIGAVLFPYEPVKRRERHLALACDELAAAGRLVRYDCGCALIPTLSRHQRVTGKTSTTAKDAHGKHLPLTGKQVVAPVMVGNGNGRERNGRVIAREISEKETSDFRQKVTAPP